MYVKKRAFFILPSFAEWQITLNGYRYLIGSCAFFKSYCLIFNQFN